MSESVSATSEKMTANLLWGPTPDAISTSQVADFASFVKARAGMDWQGNFQALWRWSTDQNATFWDLFWDWHGVIGDKGDRLIEDESAMPGARFFPDARLNYAENMLAEADDRLAISALARMVGMFA